MFGEETARVLFFWGGEGYPHEVGRELMLMEEILLMELGEMKHSTTIHGDKKLRKLHW